ncbi:MAG: riboflavin synthase [Alphaproteobacteria bacterium]|nr:riboflavin synthase [Alphaproteobacteria bacterium]
MFTGIVSDLGEVQRVERRGDTHLVITTGWNLEQIAVGASIACSGVCLTVTDKGGGAESWFSFAASAETLSRTTIKEWYPGTSVNLERPVRVGDELGGHIVTGHIDTTAELIESLAEGESTRMTFSAPSELMSLIASKGSIALDGVSLTVNETSEDRFGVNIISHTAKATTLGRLKPHARVNLEVDLVARYVQRLLKT